ncbi:hypothetical protein DFH08DRAFT_961480 [Mycena albidolilacea]|uniref:DUF6533 domain-containing protein n=1 Tax=Mycena albidolilacea TaxID=1033008 RepID=A0AAD7A0I8_9AGAR|nr:hypothetical protein DFH08DRAFT_961480 [Mycena albidolilacea]
MDAQIQALFLHLLQSIQSIRFSAIGSATVLFYDHLITFDDEIEFIWRKDWSILKGVFIFHRYLGLTCLIIGLCGVFWIQWEMWGYSTVVVTAELVLLLWIFVIYNRNRVILLVLAVSFMAQLISVVAILAQSFSQIKISANLLPGLEFCFLINEPQFFYWYWLPILVYNTIILGLFVYKGRHAFLRSKNAHVNLLNDVYRKSFINFFAIFIAYLLCCVLWLTGDFSLGQIPIGFALSFSITNSTRLLINIRHAYYAREEVDIQPTRLIYANQAPAEEWLFELRNLRI